MKSLFTAGLLLLATLLGCGTPGAPLPPSLELPQTVQDLHASRKGDKVSLAWTVPHETTDHTTIRHLGPTRICRSLKVGMTECTDEVGEVDTPKLVAAAEAAEKAKSAAAKATAGNKNKPRSAAETSTKPAPVIATFTDTLPHDLQTQNPAGFVNYAVETLNTRGRSAGMSNQVQVPLAPTLPPPTDLAARLTAEGIVLNWTGVLHEHESPELSHIYRVYRREQGSAVAVAIGEVQLSTSPQAEFVDRSFEWQKTYEYWVTVVTVVSEKGRPRFEVEGDNSPAVTVFANDVFPPAVPTGLQAVFSGVGQKPFIDLTWAPDTDPDLAGYNVYRREDNGPWVRINSALVPTPAFRDSNVAAGHTYSYSVSAVDVRGNESARSQPATERVP